MKVRKIAFWIYVTVFFAALHIATNIPPEYFSQPNLTAVLFGLGAVIFAGITLVPAVKPFRENAKNADRRMILSLFFSGSVVLSYITLLIRLYLLK